MKTAITSSNIRPYNSKQLLFEEEQKKRAAKRDSVLGNLQNTGAAASQSAAAQTKPAAQGGIVQTKPASLVSSGKQNSGGIIQMKPNAFSPNARTANAAAGMVKSDNSSTVRMQSTGSTGNLQKPRRTPNMTRGEAWGMLENERKDKRSFSVPSGFSEQGKDVFMQLMELPDLGLDGSESKKHEKVVELKRSVPETSAAKTKVGPTLEETALKRIEDSNLPRQAIHQSTDEEAFNAWDEAYKDKSLLDWKDELHYVAAETLFGLKPAEFRLAQEKGLKQAFYGYIFSRKARNMWKVLSNGTELVDGSRLNAFHHAYWMALTAFHFGAKDAVAWGHAHEQYGPRTNPFEKDGGFTRVTHSIMDLHNNQIGAQIGEAAQSISDFDKALLAELGTHDAVEFAKAYYEATGYELYIAVKVMQALENGELTYLIE